MTVIYIAAVNIQILLNEHRLPTILDECIYNEEAPTIRPTLLF